MNLKRKRKRNKKRVNNIIYLFGVTKQNPQKKNLQRWNPQFIIFGKSQTSLRMWDSQNFLKLEAYSEGHAKSQEILGEQYMDQYLVSIFLYCLNNISDA